MVTKLGEHAKRDTMTDSRVGNAANSARHFLDEKHLPLTPHDFSAVRKRLASARLNPNYWRQLAENVRKFAPDVVVLLARRLPRMYQLLDEDLRFGSASVVSDFSIMFLNQSLRGKKIAVVDDSVNVGTSLCNVRDRLEHLGATVSFFAIAHKKNDISSESTASIIRDTIFVSGGNKQSIIWNDATYEAESKKIAKALSLLNRPYEIEFPVFSVKFSDGYAYKEIGNKLCTVFPQRKVHRLGLWENVHAGLERYTIDFENMSKWRVYVDAGGKEITFVPMISHEAWQEDRAFLPEVWRAGDAAFAAEGAAKCDAFPDESRYRLRQFMTALHWGCSTLPQLLEVLGLNKPCLVRTDVCMLFGEEFGEILCCGYETAVKNGAIPLYQPVAISQQAQVSSLWDAMHEDEAIKKHFSKVMQAPNNSGVQSNAESFLRFFLALVEAIGESNCASYLLDAPSFLPKREDVHKKQYLRLRAGVTLTDLHRFMAWYWGYDVNNISDALRHRISALLDQQIDQGFVVPVIGFGGQRVFRKGEPSPYDRFLIFAMQRHGIIVSEDDDYTNILKKLNSSPQREAVQQLMSRFDQRIMV